MQIEDYADRLRAEYGGRYAVAFALIEQLVDDLDPDSAVAEIGRIRKAMTLVEQEHADG